MRLEFGDLGIALGILIAAVVFGMLIVSLRRSKSRRRGASSTREGS
jgi:hypothetical protein